MPKCIDLTVQEDVKVLEANLRKTSSDRERGRLKALRLVKQ